MEVLAEKSVILNMHKYNNSQKVFFSHIKRSKINLHLKVLVYITLFFLPIAQFVKNENSKKMHLGNKSIKEQCLLQLL